MGDQNRNQQTEHTTQPGKDAGSTAVGGGMSSQGGQQQHTSTSGAEGEQDPGRARMGGGQSDSDMERQRGMGSQDDMGDGERSDMGGTGIAEDDEDLGGRAAQQSEGRPEGE